MSIRECVASFILIAVCGIVVFSLPQSTVNPTVIYGPFGVGLEMRGDAMRTLKAGTWPKCHP